MKNTDEMKDSEKYFSPYKRIGLSEERVDELADKIKAIDETTPKYSDVLDWILDNYTEEEKEVLLIMFGVMIERNEWMFRREEAVKMALAQMIGR